MVFREADVHFRLGGRDIDLTATAVHAAVRGVEPEPVRLHAVRIAGGIFPVKQVVALATGLDRLDFTTVNARRVLQRLGFEVVRMDTDRGEL